MCNINERIEKLKSETNDLRKEVKDLKETLRQQNDLIISLLSKQNDMLEENIEAERNVSPVVYSGKKISEFSRRFPLESMEDLKKFELEIDDDNKANIIIIIQSLLSPQGLLKNVVNVLSDKIIMKSNVDGHHNKARLLNFPKTIDLLYMASRKDDDNYSSKMFLEDLRRSLRVVKNRCHKNNCRARQKLLLREEQERVEQEQQQNAEHSFMGKTEEIYFD